MGAYITHNTRLAETSQFEDDDGLYKFYRVPDGVREYAGQLAVHPLAGLIGVGTVGRTYVNTIEYDFSHVEAAYIWGNGTTRTKITYGYYEPSNLPYANREIRLISQRYWIAAWDTAVEIAGGDYFYGDSGTSATVTRYFGDVTVSVFSRVKSSDEAIAGISIGIPLTTHLGFQRGPVAVVGMPRFNYARSSSFGNGEGVNVLRPLLLVEPKPIYNLTTDWLDSERMTPDHASYSTE